MALADFALDIANTLFEDMLPPLFQRVCQDVEGKITLQFDGDTLTDAPNGQISIMGNLAEGGKVTINTLPNTRRPVLHPEAAAVMRVLAVATGAGCDPAYP